MSSSKHRSALKRCGHPKAGAGSTLRRRFFRSISQRSGVHSWHLALMKVMVGRVHMNYLLGQGYWARYTLCLRRIFGD